MKFTSRKCDLPVHLIFLVLLSPLLTGLGSTTLNLQVLTKLEPGSNQVMLSSKLPWLKLLRIYGGDAAFQYDKRSVVVNLLSPEERILRNKLKQNQPNKTSAEAKVPYCDRTKKLMDGVRELARYLMRSKDLDSLFESRLNTRPVEQ